MCASLPLRSQITNTDGLRIKTIEYPGIAVITENFHGTSRRVLRQTSRLGETRFAYQVTGACITHVSDPNKVSGVRQLNA